jgi:putative ABC transport system substrate-binding protein
MLSVGSGPAVRPDCPQQAGHMTESDTCTTRDMTSRTARTIHMNRRDFLVGLLIAAAPQAAWSQQPSKRRLALFHPAIPAVLITDDSFWRAFFADLRRLGYTEGDNLIVDRYSAEGHHERYADLAQEIVTSRPDVIVTVSTKVIIALLTATRTIPVVANMLEDPIKAGLVLSLARPGINLTGVSRDAGVEIWGKRLQMLKEAIPSASTVAFLGFPERWEGPAGLVLRDASSQLGISLIGMVLKDGTPRRLSVSSRRWLGDAPMQC